MLSLKRLSYVLLIVLGICAIFLFYNVNGEQRDLFDEGRKVPEKELLLSKKAIEKDEERCFYIIGTEKKEVYGDIYRNVCRLLGDWRVSYKKTERLDMNGLVDDAVLVFCDDVVSDHVDLEQLAAFIEAGGKTVFAAGIPDGYQDSYLLPVLGIVEKTIKENYRTFRFSEGFLPLQEEVMTYAGFNASTWLDLGDDAEVYAEDSEKKVPIVYSYPYGRGEILMINATFLSDEGCGGILAAGIGSLLDEIMYPVLGTECVCLEHFPDVTYTNDAVCMKLYGRTTEAFIRDVVWPVFQGMAVRGGITYTSEEPGVSERDQSVLPKATEGMELEDGLMFTLASALTSYGVISHTFDMNCFVYANEETTGWDTDRYRLEEFEKKIFSKTGYLQNVSLSESEYMVKSYREMEYTWKREGQKIEILTDHMVEGQPFFLRTEQEIAFAEGAEYTKISDDYYIVRLNKTKAVLTYR